MGGVGDCLSGGGCTAGAACASALIITLGVFAGALGAHALLPAIEVQGYAARTTDDRGGAAPLRYRLNGPICLLLTVGVWLVLEDFAGFDGALSARHFGWTVLWCNVIGIVATAYVLATNEVEDGVRCLTVDQLTRAEHGEGAAASAPTWRVDKALAARNDGPPPATALQRFYLGHAWNVTLCVGRADAKMALYLVGACMLAWNVLSFVAMQAQLAPTGGPSGGVSVASATYGALMGWFLLEYMCGEIVHLWTYDIFAERVGFKLTWGCCAFYTCFYCVGMHAVARATTEMPAWASAITVLVFVSGWVLTRGANMQNFCYKMWGEPTFLCGLVRNETVPGTRILCSGWWGLARHVNYCGEIIQAIALALPASFVGAPPWAVVLAWLYPLYYVGLFVPRQMDDDRLCAAKYGDKWEEYVAVVPYRILPGVW